MIEIEEIHNTAELMKKLTPEQQRVIAEAINKIFKTIREIVRDEKKMELLRKLQNWCGKA